MPGEGEVNLVEALRTKIALRVSMCPDFLVNLMDHQPILEAHPDLLSDKKLIIDEIINDLEDHFSKNQYFPFEKLHLNLSPDSCYDVLKILFRHLKNYPHVKKIQINKELSVEQYEELKKLVKENNITVYLDFHIQAVGSIENESSRKLLLNEISKHRRNAAIARLKEPVKPVLSSPSMRVRKKQASVDMLFSGEVRAVKLGDPKKMLTFDVATQAEQQHQLQTELQQETQQATQIQAQEQNEVSVVDENMSVDNLVIKEMYPLLAVTEYRLQLQQAEDFQCTGLKMLLHFDLWKRFIDSGKLEKNIHYVTREAIAKIHSLPQYFLGGLNFDNLPIGFFIQKYHNKYALCYDAMSVATHKNQSPLRPILKPKFQPEPWLGDWRQFDSSNDYSSEAKSFCGTVDEQGVPAIYSSEIKTEKIYQMMEALNPELSKNILKRHQWFFNLVNKINFKSAFTLTALLDILYHTGCEGLDALLNALEKLKNRNITLFEEFFINFITHNYQYPGNKASSAASCFITTENLLMIEKLADLNDAELNWWKNIVSCQHEVTGYVDLAVLYNGFMYFLAKLPPPLVLPYECPINMTLGNPLVQLDRLLGILGKVDAAHLNEQINNLTVELAIKKEKNLIESHINEYHTWLSCQGLNYKRYVLVDDEIEICCSAIRKLRVILALAKRQHAYFGMIDFINSEIDCFLSHIASCGEKGSWRGCLTSECCMRRANRLVEFSKKINIKESIDLSSEGAWYAARWHHYHYYHPKMQLTLKDNSAETHFKVSFDDLLKLASKASVKADKIKISDYLEMEVAFHRFVGQSEHIAVPYQYYVDLTDVLYQAEGNLCDKIRLLACLAIATTGPRGSKELDIAPLLTLLQSDLAKKDNFGLIVYWISKELNTLSNKPTLSELTALVTIIAENEGQEKSSLIKCFCSENPSEKVLHSWKLWQQNTKHLSSVYFSLFYEKIRKVDKKEFDQWSRIAAILKSDPATDGDASRDLWRLADNIKQKPQYAMILNILSTLDLEKTDHDKLPTLLQLTEIFNDAIAKNLETPQAVFTFIIEKLPDCVFNRAANDVQPLDAKLLQKAIDDFNKKLAEYKLRPLDNDRLKENAPEYFSELYSELPEKLKEIVSDQTSLTGFLLEAAVTTAEETIKSLAFPAFKSFFLFPLEQHTRQFPDLNKLKSIYPEPPAISGDVEKIHDELKAFQDYTAILEGLFSVLVHLKKSWGEKFTLNNIINSPLQFSPKQLERILCAIQKQNYPLFPEKLFKSLLPEKCQLPPHVNSEDLHYEIEKIILLDQLSLMQKAQLIGMLYKHVHNADIINEMISGFKIIGVNSSELQAAFFSACLFIIDNNKVESIKNINLILASSFNENDKMAVLILLNTATNDSVALLTELVGIQGYADEDKIKLIKMISFGFLKKNYDGTLKSQNECVMLINSLNALYEGDKQHFDCIAVLYDKTPKPTYAALQKLINDKSFLSKYDLDPFGARIESAELEKQFNIDKIHERIDAILDLGRDKRKGREIALFHNEREKLYDAIGYVTAVGKSYPLTIPGMDADKGAYQKPVKDLKSDEIKLLVKHYRLVISGKIPVSDKEKWNAKLELMALLREVLYRTTGMMAYDTQMLSILNVILQGGSVFSEIRTGEGKSIITAMMAVAKWAQGGVVDVASANMALAKRDLEENKDFYDYLGIQTALISASSTNNQYRQDGTIDAQGNVNEDGIHYSDVSELSLWQEQQLLMGEKLPNKVSLIADEVDFNVLDNTTQFRYATSLDEAYHPHYNPYEHLYPAVLAFVRRDDLFLKINCSAKQDIQHLKDYVLSDDCSLDNLLKSKLVALPEIILNRWINSAYIATKLIQDEDYVIRQGKINIDGEEVLVSQAQVKINGRANPQSRFSEGVHQFLHTMLNEKMTDNEKFKKLCNGNRFVIEPEKTYLASRSAKNTMDYYLRPDENGKSRGDVIGLTGTLGTFQDRMELFKNYGAKFFRIPPHKPLRRDPKPHKLAKIALFKKRTNQSIQQAHFNAIYEDVIRAKKCGQSILIICNTVEFSEALYLFFIKKKLGDKLQIHNGEQLNQDEESVVKKAGESEMVTISTLMFGRGTDIKPQNERGLHVITTAISGEREYGQNIGRAGRNGAKGSDQLILSESEFTQRNKKVPSGAAELRAAIKEIRNDIDKNKTADRYERQLFADVKDQFFKQYTVLSAKLKKQSACGNRDWSLISFKSHLRWEEFLRSLDQQWGALLTLVRNDIKRETSDEMKRMRLLPRSLHRNQMNALPKKIDDWEKTKLLEKIKELAQFGNENWLKTVDDIVKRVDAKQSSDSSDSESPHTPVIAAFSVTPVLAVLPDASVLAQPLNMILSADKLAVPLKPSAFQPLKAYVKLTNNIEYKKSDEYGQLQAKLIESCLEAIFEKKLFKTTADTFGARRIYLTLVFLGKEHYRLSKLNAPNFAHHKAMFELIKVVGENGSDDEKKEIVDALNNVKNGAVYDSKPSELGEYLLRFNGFEKQLTVQNFNAVLSKRKASMLNNQSDLENSASSHPNSSASTAQYVDPNQRKWEFVARFALPIINNYLSFTTFGKAQDRRTAAEKIKAQLTAPNIDNNKLATEKITDLITFLQEITRSIADKDFAKDKTSFFYRNKQGSRLQTAINDIMAFALTQSPLQVVSPVVIGKINEILNVINKRAKNSKVNLLYAPVPENAPIDYLFTLRDRLLKDIAQLEVKKSSGFWMSNTRGLSHLLKTVSQQLDMLCVSHALTIEDKNKRDVLMLRQRLQENLRLLAAPIGKDFLDAVYLDVTDRGYAGVDGFPSDASAAQKGLLQKAMFEIERLMTPKEGANEFKFDKLCSYNGGKNVTFMASYSENNEHKKLKIAFDDLYPGSEKVICSFVDMKPQDIRSTPSNRH